MIFVPELLDRNCAEKNKTSIFKHQKTLSAISSQKGIFDDDNDSDDMMMMMMMMMINCF